MVKVFRSITRIIAALVVLLTLSSCGQPAPTPQPTATAPVQSETLTIGYAGLAYGSEDKAQTARMTESLVYLHRLLRGRGWDIAFLLKNVPYQKEGVGPSVVDGVKADVAAGTAPDGYIVQDEAAQALLDAGLALDPREVLPEAAPALYDRYRELIDGGIGGVPTATNLFNAVDLPIVLYLEKGAATKADGITCVSDVLAFLENNAGMRLGAELRFGEASLLGAWAGEQGYYSLDEMLIAGRLFAKLGDESCKVVPIEDIPGFDSFFTRCIKLVRDGRFVDSYSEGGLIGDAVAGYIGWFNNDMGYQFLLGHKKPGKDYLAFPLKGCAGLNYLQGKPTAFTQLSLRSAAKASGLAKFVEWALLDEQNYRLVRYGAEGVDYRLVGGRVEYLNYRQPLRAEDWDWNSESKAYFMNNLNPFGDMSMELATVYAADNYAEVLAATRPLSRPAYGLFDRWHVGDEKLQHTQSQYERTISDREELLFDTLLYSGGDAERFAAQCLKQLGDMRAQTNELVAAYQARVDELLAAREGDAGGK